MRQSFPLRSPAALRPELPHRPRRLAAVASIAAAGGLLLLGQAATTPAQAATVNTARSVEAYDPGDNPDTLFEIAEAALGELNGDTGFGGLNPFNPPFASSDIVVIGPGGHLTLKTEVPFRTAGFNLGVYVNNGLVDVSEFGTGVVGSTPSFFSPTPKARVSISNDNVSWEYLNGGDVIDFDKPTNVYLDQSISDYFQPVGEDEADMAKPWTGSLADLAGLDYAGIRAEFDGGAGGNWLNLDGLALDEARYVRFEATDTRMVVDAIATTDALPEPSAGLALLGGLLLVLKRRRA